MSDTFVWDEEREARLGFDEAVFCGGKTPAQVELILERAIDADRGLLLTRLDAGRHEALRSDLRERLDYDAVSATALLGAPRAVRSTGGVAIGTAGTSDLVTAGEAARTLRYYGIEAGLFADVGVAAIWRLSARLGEIRGHAVCIVVAGMDAALPSVVGGLFRGPVIAVPTSVGYGVAAGGRTALHSMLSSCAPGITVCNIDNGYGAACAALRILNAT